MVRSLESFAAEVLVEVDGAPGGSFMAVSHFEPAISDSRVSSPRLGSKGRYAFGPVG